MPCRCFACDLSFDTVREFVEHKFTEHKLVHQEPPEKDMILRSGKPASASSPKVDYRGDILCPNCRQPMKVVVEKERWYLLPVRRISLVDSAKV